MNHLAIETKNTLEPILERRGTCTRGFRKWELKLLWMAYEELGTPLSERKFGLSVLCPDKPINYRY